MALNHVELSLPKNSHAWQKALDSVAHLLPVDVHCLDIKALQKLPIFALIVVVQNDALKAGANLPSPIKAWADEQANWQIVAVEDDKQAERLSIPSSLANGLSDVSVYRYLLIPTTQTLMSPEKKTAAAHIIDEQITQRLRHFLNQIDTNSGTTNTIQAADTTEYRHRIDCHILSIGHILNEHKIAFFDMDSTLIEQEVIVELAKTADIGDKVNEITESAMRGEINFDESFAQRVALLTGISTDVLEGIQQRLTLSEGAKTTLFVLKALGYHTVLLSGGFTYFARFVAEQLGIDEVHANVLDVEEGFVTGNVQLPIINGEKKAELVKKIAHREGVDLTQVICVGDGANDLPMMSIADLGLAYRAKPIVQAKADAAINTTGLEGVLYALGLPQIG